MRVFHGPSPRHAILSRPCSPFLLRVSSQAVPEARVSSCRDIRLPWLRAPEGQRPAGRSDYHAGRRTGAGLGAPVPE